MAFAAAKITELPLRSALPPASSSGGSGGSSLHLLFTSLKPPPPRPCALGRRCLCHSVRTTNPQSASSRSGGGGGGGGKPHSVPWLNKWPPPSREVDGESPGKVAGSNSRGEVEPRYSGNDRGQNAIERIVLRLRNLGLGSDDGEEEEEEEGESGAAPPTGEERLHKSIEIGLETSVLVPRSIKIRLGTLVPKSLFSAPMPRSIMAGPGLKAQKKNN